MENFYLSNLIKKAVQAAVVTGLLFGAAETSLAGNNQRYFEKNKQTRGTLKTKANARLIATISRPGNSQDYYYNQSNSSWMHVGNSTYTYNSQGMLTERLTKLPVINTNMAREIHTYDAQGNETLYEYYAWNNNTNAWEQNYGSRYTYTYNTAGKISEEIYEYWMNNAWVMEEKETNTYNADGTMASTTWSDMVSGTWVPSWRDNYSYSNGAMTSIVEQEYVNGTWEDDWKYINITWHTLNDKPASYIGQAKVNGVWENAENTTYVYDANDGYVSTEMEWVNGTWINDYRSTEIMDAHKNYTGYIEENWTNGAWVKNYEDQQVLTYNATNDITERIYRSWDQQTNNLTNTSKEVYSNFQVFVSGLNKPVAQLSAEVYPNPVQEALHISLPQTSQQEITATLTDVTGKNVGRYTIAAGTFQAQLPANTLPSGVYLLHLQSENSQNTFKIIKQ